MTRLATYRTRLERSLAPLGTRDWANDDLEEALRHARDRYSEIYPPRTIATLTLTSTAREIDISSLTYTNVLRVWWDYDSSDPEHPPNWRDFELWSGDILFINDDDEPDSGDTVRLWMEQAATIQNLDDAGDTNIPDQHDSLILIGAAGYAIQALALEQSERLNVSDWTVRRLRELSQQKLTEFEARLRQLAAHRDLQDSGKTARMPQLDRWDDEWA